MTLVSAILWTVYGLVYAFSVVLLITAAVSDRYARDEALAVGFVCTLFCTLVLIVYLVGNFT